jgi:hypothetical protein
VAAVGLGVERQLPVSLGQPHVVAVEQAHRPRQIRGRCTPRSFVLDFEVCKRTVAATTATLRELSDTDNTCRR